MATARSLMVEDQLALPLPEEPAALRAEMRHVLEQDPERGEALLQDGRWLLEPLWYTWGSALVDVGVSSAQVLTIIRGYRYEVHLWLVGERPWEQCVSGLAGRVVRRIDL